MSSATKAWAVATSIAAVEAMKDQGFCGWNFTVRSLHHHAKNQFRSASKPRKLSSPSSTLVSRKYLNRTTSRGAISMHGLVSSFRTPIKMKFKRNLLGVRTKP
ncbi:hypothetical protein OIU85_004153 [Salix viminalis]|uniref:Uncharacterized protein n=1 Tax=Salix viminalis TaxID=40686 RepID=A0A9Q0PS13_SALVM|nr:hypothetical protein OIU85_004153 [Salix viminalis]